MLREMIAREHQTPNPRDLSGVLTSGTFNHLGTRVLGSWPLEKGFVEGLLGGGDRRHPRSLVRLLDRPAASRVTARSRFDARRFESRNNTRTMSLRRQFIVRSHLRAIPILCKWG
jgi:hypothetical protein